MKTTIFTIALVFSLGTAFSQETEIVLPTTQHAINTKGTGFTNGKITTSNPNPSQEVTSEEKRKEYVGHVTLMKREAKPTTPDEDEEQNEKNNESKRVKKTGHVTLNR
jgi:hypothetical protein